MFTNIRMRAALCLALALVNSEGTAQDVHRSATPPPAPAAAAPAEDERPCAKHAELASRWVAAKRRVAASERELATLEEDPVLAETTHCSRSVYSESRCRDRWYSRELELERARSRRDQAEAQLVDVEEEARVTGTPMACLVDPAD